MRTRRSPLDTLASPRLAAVLIGVLLIGGIVSFLVPQRAKPDLTLYAEWSAGNPSAAKLADTLGLDDVFASTAMALVYVLLAVNLTACTYRRVIRRRSRKPVLPRPPEDAYVVEVANADEARGAVGRALAHAPRTWAKRVPEGGASGFVADGGALGFAGSVVMHAGLILLLVGGLVSALTRFSGEMDLTVGQALPDIAESYPTPPKEPVIGSGYRDGAVGLRSLQFDYEQGKMTSAEALMEFTDGTGAQVQKVRVNEPARWQGKAFLLFNGGHAALVRVTDESGAVLLEGVVRLGDRAEGGYSDEVELPDSRRLKIRTIADAGNAEASDTDVMALRDPRVVVAIDNGATSAPLSTGEVFEADDVSVSVGDVTLWTTILVRGDGGIPVVYFSFLLILAGVSLRLFSPNRLVAVRVEDREDGSVAVAVWSRKRYPSEDRVARHLEAVLRSEENA